MGQEQRVERGTFDGLGSRRDAATNSVRDPPIESSRRG